MIIKTIFGGIMSNITAQKLMFFDDWPYEYSRGFEKKQGKPIK
jgi:hypothetical protein